MASVRLEGWIAGSNVAGKDVLQTIGCQAEILPRKKVSVQPRQSMAILRPCRRPVPRPSFSTHGGGLAMRRFITGVASGLILLGSAAASAQPQTAAGIAKHQFSECVAKRMSPNKTVSSN